jgi:NAD(P)H-hydrate epimerase
MKVVTGDTMRLMDRRAIEECGVSGLVLMENAGYACVQSLINEYGVGGGRLAVIVAGKGNNGGDGYVIARLLQERGWKTKVFILARRTEITGEASINLDRLAAAVVAFCPAPGELRHAVAQLDETPTVIVDALLGTGLKSEVKGVYGEAIDVMNATGWPVLAVDIPSGIDAGSGRILGRVVRADLTVTFAAAKLGNILYPGAEFCGKLHVADIGMPEQVISEAAGYDFVDAAAVRLLLRRRDRQAHKGGCGHCLVIAGSTGKTGAAALAANSAVRAGAGLVTVAVPAALNAIMEIKTTEAMSLPLADGGSGSLEAAAHRDILAALAGKDAVALGPGAGRNPATSLLLRRLAEETALPLVIDADGLNAVAEDVSLLLRRTTPHVILTPHPGEMARLADVSIDHIEKDRIAAARNFSRKYGAYLLLKGARTIVAAPDGAIAINGSGNPGMASGGMGDVLSGVLVALLGQGYEPFTACKIGAFIHGFAADLVAAEKGEIGMSAVDVQERLPHAFRALFD